MSALTERTKRYREIDGIIRTFYECISGPDGGQDWARNAELYHPDALITRTRIVDGMPTAHTFDVAGFRQATIPLLSGRSFYETETQRKTQRFGQIAHVFSAYAARETPDSPDILFSGINMIHLWKGMLENWPGERWWIMSIIWDNERDGVTINPHWFE